MATYYNIRTGETLTQEDFSARICDVDYTCCSQFENVWISGNVAKNEYQWQVYFIENNLCSDGNAPVNTVAPAISQLDGLLIGDELAISSNGTWTSDTPITNYEYRWTRNGSVIAGETNVNYFIQDADMDANLVCQVRAKDSDGWSTWVNSNSFLIPIYWGVTGGASVWGTSTNNVYA